MAPGIGEELASAITLGVATVVADMTATFCDSSGAKGGARAGRLSGPRRLRCTQGRPARAATAWKATVAIAGHQAGTAWAVRKPI